MCANLQYDGLHALNQKIDSRRKVKALSPERFVSTLVMKLRNPGESPRVWLRTYRKEIVHGFWTPPHQAYGQLLVGQINISRHVVRICWKFCHAWKLAKVVVPLTPRGTTIYATQQR